MPYAIETIDYQYNDTFPDRLEQLVQSIYSGLKGKYTVKDTDPNVLKMQDLILERFGMRVKFTPELIMFSSAAIIPFFKDFEASTSSLQALPSQFTGLSQGGVLDKFKSIIREREKNFKKIDNKTGYINTKLAKMGGYMSEVTHYLILDFNFFKMKEVTSGELTAIILHELGHAFDGMEEHYRLQSTNRAVMDILADVYDNNTDKALYKYKNTFTEKEYKDAQLSSSKDRQDFCGKLALSYVGAVQSQLQSAKYDETNFENMADTFATRFGRGKELSSALAKLHGVTLNGGNDIRAVLLTLEVLSLATLFLLVPVYGFILYGVIMSYLFRVSASPMVYDEFPERLGRIRNTIVNGIKKKGLPEKVVIDALDQITFIEKMAQAGKQYKPLTSHLGDWLYSDSRKDLYYINLQQSIEKHLNNRLFVQAARIRVSA